MHLPHREHNPILIASERLKLVLARALIFAANLASWYLSLHYQCVALKVRGRFQGAPGVVAGENLSNRWTWCLNVALTAI